MIKVTVITPTFNRAIKLKRNIESVKSQTFQDIEQIIVDNMSMDGTEEIVKSYQQEANHPVIYIRERDSGPYGAMNKGIKRARGEWVHILNSDDTYISSSTLSSVFSREIDKFDMIACAIRQGDDSKNKYWKPTYDERYRLYRFPHPGLIIKKSFYDKNGLYNEKYKIISDAIYASKNYDKVYYIILDTPLVLMRLGGISTEGTYGHFYERMIYILFYSKFPVSLKYLELTLLFREVYNFILQSKKK